MKAYIIGTGVNGSDSLTAEASAAIGRAELIVGAERMVSSFRGSGKRVVCSYKPDETAEIIKSSGAGTAAVLMSGDSSFFSGTKKLLPLLSDEDTEVIPGISSVSYMCAKTGLSYETMKFISLHGRNGSIAVHSFLERDCSFLLGGDMNAGDVCGRLTEYGLADVCVYIGERLGYPDERVVSGRACELTGETAGKLAVMIVHNDNNTGYIPSAIADDRFIRGDVPMTKSYVRNCCVASLDIHRDSVCWDVGCGTGSVSVEMAYRCPDGRVLAFDKSPEAVRLTNENSRRFSADNIIVKEGLCPDVLEDAEAPDKVFIGGTSGCMDDLFSCIFSRNPEADIAVTAVSLETLHQAAEAFDRYNGGYSITQLAVTDTHRIGSHTMMRAQNPVFIIKGRLK